MTSLLSGTKQVGESGYFINVGSLVGAINGRVEPTSGTNSGANGGTFSTAQWCTIISLSQSSFGTAQGMVAGGVVSTLATAGRAVLRDLGRTVVSSLRTFRKVQLVIANNGAASTFGVNGPLSGTASAGVDYFTGYIELGFEGNGTPAAVAQYGR